MCCLFLVSVYLLLVVCHVCDLCGVLCIVYACFCLLLVVCGLWFVVCGCLLFVDC